MKRTDSIQSKRKVSSLSDRSDTSDAAGTVGPTGISNVLSGGIAAPAEGSGGEESPGVLSDDHDHPLESPDSNDTDETSKEMPWIKVTFFFENFIQ